jgi:hypothetical protein
MYDSDPMRAISARVPTEPLSPARAALADAIERLAAASARMEVAQSALVGVGEAAGLDELARCRRASGRYDPAS